MQALGGRVSGASTPIKNLAIHYITAVGALHIQSRAKMSMELAVDLVHQYFRSYRFEAAGNKEKAHGSIKSFERIHIWKYLISIFTFKVSMYVTTNIVFPHVLSNKMIPWKYDVPNPLKLNQR
ncbi:uncharacterized protein LOC120207775 [Hibiscus syriacus]|uniref:uncharacterized protein LOC120207775 n=1 Tax=Hibiscus syriacus TaxID=106335 RepID=UPI001921BDBF|nr:uncharacterized protein LOC120207775 [Hibiscus syriacus]